MSRAPKFLFHAAFAVLAAIACVQVYDGIRSARAGSGPARQPGKAYPEFFAAERAALSTVHLKNGNALTGKIVHNASAHLTVEWKGALVTFAKAEIARVGLAEEFPEGVYLKAARSASWPYAHEPVVSLVAGGVVDGAIVQADARKIVVRESLENGTIDYELPVSSVRGILWSRFNADENAGRRGELTAKHPAISNYAHLTAAEPSVAPAAAAFAKSVRSSASYRAIQKAARSYADFWQLFKSIAS